MDLQYDGKSIPTRPVEKLSEKQSAEKASDLERDDAVPNGPKLAAKYKRKSTARHNCYHH